MKLPLVNQIWRVLGDGDHGKYAMDCAKLEVDGGARIVATNGRVVAIVPVEVDPKDEPGLIHGDAIGRPPPTEEDGEPFGNRTLRVSNGMASVELKPEVREFPDWRKAVPEKDAPCAVEFAISAQYLYDLARALVADGFSGVRLRVPASDSDGIVRDAIRVDGPHGSFGAIMPMAEPTDAT